VDGDIDLIFPQERGLEQIMNAPDGADIGLCGGRSMLRDLHGRGVDDIHKVANWGFAAGPTDLVQDSGDFDLRSRAQRPGSHFASQRCRATTTWHSTKSQRGLPGSERDGKVSVI
jgi:hypothetical protein